jgi:DNA-binding GntR family transcriptional regulator
LTHRWLTVPGGGVLRNVGLHGFRDVATAPPGYAAPVASTEDPTTARLSDQVAELLRERLVEGRYAAGERLRRREIADELSVSETVAGEALRMLHREAFVELGPQGAIVRSDEPLLVAAYQFREAVDGLAARLAAIGPGPALAGPLGTLVDELDAAMAAGDYRRAIAVNVEFHCLIIDASANPLLMAQRHLMRWTSRGLGTRAASQMQAINDDHHVIAAAIVRGDPDAAEKAAREHVRAFASYLHDGGSPKARA